jgi:hypothetical protein
MGKPRDMSKRNPRDKSNGETQGYELRYPGRVRKGCPQGSCKRGYPEASVQRWAPKGRERRWAPGDVTKVDVQGCKERWIPRDVCIGGHPGM